MTLTDFLVGLLYESRPQTAAPAATRKLLRVVSAPSRGDACRGGRSPRPEPVNGPGVIAVTRAPTHGD